MNITRGHKSHYNIKIMSNTYRNDRAINFDSNDYIILKSSFELRALELILNVALNFTKRTLELILLMVFTLHNN